MLNIVWLYLLAICYNRLSRQFPFWTEGWFTNLVATLGFALTAFVMTGGFLGCPMDTVAKVSMVGQCAGVMGAFGSLLIRK